jgi:hypothetical protein
MSVLICAARFGGGRAGPESESGGRAGSGGDASSSSPSESVSKSIRQISDLSNIRQGRIAGRIDTAMRERVPGILMWRFGGKIYLQTIIDPLDSENLRGSPL